MYQQECTKNTCRELALKPPKAKLPQKTADNINQLLSSLTKFIEASSTLVDDLKKTIGSADDGDCECANLKHDMQETQTNKSKRLSGEKPTEDECECSKIAGAPEDCHPQNNPKKEHVKTFSPAASAQPSPNSPSSSQQKKGPEEEDCECEKTTPGLSKTSTPLKHNKVPEEEDCGCEQTTPALSKTSTPAKATKVPEEEECECEKTTPTSSTPSKSSGPPTTPANTQPSPNKDSEEEGCECQKTPVKTSSPQSKQPPADEEEDNICHCEVGEEAPPSEPKPTPPPVLKTPANTPASTPKSNSQKEKKAAEEKFQRDRVKKIAVLKESIAITQKNVADLQEQVRQLERMYEDYDTWNIGGQVNPAALYKQIMKPSPVPHLNDPRPTQPIMHKPSVKCGPSTCNIHLPAAKPLNARNPPKEKISVLSTVPLLQRFC